MSIPRAGLTPRAKVLLPLFLITLLVASYYRLSDHRDGSEPAVLEGKTMGTSYRVVVAQATLGESEHTELERGIQGELDRIEQLMSTYRPDSELSRFNASSSTTPFSVSKDTAEVVRAALEISKQTQGAFDATVRPLVALWGFGAGAQTEPPSEPALAEARQHVGYRKVTVHADPPRIEKHDPEVSIDLSAIAKGYAVDRVAELLAERELPHFMVEVGGEIRVSGEREPGVRWRIGIEQPDTLERTAHRVLPITDIGMATSGDYRNYYEKDGVRISHTIDPRSGRPITHSLASVSVLHPQAMIADAYATALTVLGPEEGFAVAERRDIAALFLIRRPDGSFEQRSTRGFAPYLSP